MFSSSTYNGLPVQSWQFRLLQLLPGQEGSPISGRLIVADNTSVGAVLHHELRLVQYKALSYTWGTGKASHQILLNDRHFDVSENLYHFLLQYRRDLNALLQEFIWVDAVCINQQDPVEKSVQVANMLSVYEKAQEVVVWLGTESLDTASAFRLINDPRISSRNDLQQLDEKAAHGMLDLYSREWPRRIWVKQEIWAAQNITVRCGAWMTAWSRFKSIPDLLPTYISRLLERSWLSAIQALVQKSTQKAWLLDEHGDVRAASHAGTLDGHDLLALLTTSTNCESTDSRDRVYALLGMSTDRHFEVDYTKSVTEVFTSLAHHIALTRCSIETVLWFTAAQPLPEGRGNLHELHGLPSWVPDWRSVAYTPESLSHRKHLQDFHSNYSLVTSILLDSVTSDKGKRGAEDLDRVLPDLCALQNIRIPSSFSRASPGSLTLHGVRLVTDEILHGSFRNVVCWIPLRHCSRDNSRWNSQSPSELRWAQTALQTWEERDAMNRYQITKRQDLAAMLDLSSTAAKIFVSHNPHELIKGFGTDAQVMHSTQRFGTSEMYYLGLPPGEQLWPGDVVACAHECGLPVLLRPSSRSETDWRTIYTFVGFVSLSKLNTSWDSVPEHGSNVKHFYWELQMTLKLKAKYGYLESFQLQ